MDFIPLEDRKSYEEIFFKNSKNNKIDASIVQVYLAQSGLPSSTLGCIWNLAIRNGSYISYPEFALAMFLAKSILNGAQLPNYLPTYIANQVSIAIESSSEVKTPAPVLGSQFANSNPSLAAYDDLNVMKVISTIESDRDWAVSPDEKARYDQIFKASDSSNLGYISGDNSRLIFSQSGLRENMLAHIWNMADMQNRGKLNSDEFAVAMHLIYKKLNGFDLPQKLPENLIPPSQKALRSLSNLAKLDAMQQQPQKKISPSSSLLSIASQDRPLTPLSEPSVVDVESEEKKRESILLQVEAKRREVANAKETADATKKQLLMIEKLILDASQQSLSAAKELASLLPHQSAGGIETISTVEIARFKKLIIDIPSYISDCRKLYNERAKNQIQKINGANSSSEGPSSKEAVVNKAAALLAERMTALGVKSTIAQTGSEKVENSHKSQKLDKKTLLLEVEQEKTIALSKISEFETRFRSLTTKIEKFISRKSSSKIEQNDDVTLKYESGIGFFSREALDLVQKMKMIKEDSYLTDKVAKKIEVGFKSQSHFAEINNAQIKNQEKVEDLSLLLSNTHSLSRHQAMANELDASNILPTTAIPLNLKVTTSANVIKSEISYPDPNPITLTLPISSQGSEKSIPFSDSAIISVLNDGILKNEKERPESYSAFKIMKEKERLTLEAKKTEVENSKKRILIPQKPVLQNLTGITETQAPNHLSVTKSFASLQKTDIAKPVGSPVLFKPAGKDSLSSPSHSSDTNGTSKLPHVENSIAHEVEVKNINSTFIVLDGQKINDLFIKKSPSPSNKDSSIVPIKSADVENRTSVEIEKKNPNPSNIKVQAPNLFAKVELSKAANLEKTLTYKENVLATTKEQSNHLKKEPITPATEDDGWEILSNSPMKNDKEISGDLKYEVVVQFDYEANEENDLPVAVGDILKVEKEDEEWIFCLNVMGRKGWLPRSFVKTIQEQSIDELRAPEDLSQAPFASAEVMFDFEARNSDEISCLAGQIVIIIDKSGIDWWLVEHGGKRGLAPANFLEEKTTAINETDAIKEILEDSPFYMHDSQKNSYASVAMLFSPSASEFPFNSSSDDINGSIEEASRREAVKEMIKTERSFVEDLGILKDQFFLPMSRMRVDMILLFSNFLQIFEVNTSILNDFENSLMNGESIGSEFLKHLDDLECYKIYCENLNGASTYLQKLRSSNPTVNSFLKSQQNLPVCKHLDLSSYLLIPMQRITRYALLLRQILHYTPEIHHEHDSTRIALQMCEELLDQINTSIKLRQSVLNIERITNMVDLELPNENCRLDLNAPTRLLGNRIFFYEGVLIKSKSGRKLNAYLFNDFLLFVHLKGNGSKPYSLYRQPLMLDSLTVKDTPDSDSFQILFEDQVMMLRALNISEKRQWINQIESARKSLRNLSSKHGDGSRASSVSKKIGTLSVLLCKACDCIDTVKTREIFALGQIENQILKSKVVPLSFQHASFNQSLIFSLPSLDEVLQISLYRFSKYSKDVYLGQAEIQLDILEYYAGKQTDVIELPLKDGGFKSLTIKLTLKK